MESTSTKSLAKRIFKEYFFIGKHQFYSLIKIQSKQTSLINALQLYISTLKSYCGNFLSKYNSRVKSSDLR